MALNTYHFIRTYTDNHYYEVEAENEQEAWHKVSELDREDSMAEKNIDFSTELEKVVEGMDEEPEDELADEDTIPEEKVAEVEGADLPR